MRRMTLGGGYVEPKAELLARHIPDLQIVRDDPLSAGSKTTCSALRRERRDDLFAVASPRCSMGVFESSSAPYVAMRPCGPNRPPPPGSGRGFVPRAIVDRDVSAAPHRQVLATRAPVDAPRRHGRWAKSSSPVATSRTLKSWREGPSRSGWRSKLHPDSGRGSRRVSSRRRARSRSDAAARCRYPGRSPCHRRPSS